MASTTTGRAARTVTTTRREIATFLAITGGLAAAGFAGVQALALDLNHLEQVGPEGWLLFAGIAWSPGIAAVLTRLIHHRSLRGGDWGFRRGRAVDYLLGATMPLLIALAAYLVLWLTGLGRLDPSRLAADAAAMFGGEVAPAPALAALQAALGLTLGLAPFAVLAVGEEIGWRGFLVPALARITSFERTAVIGGLAWAVFHYPLMLFVDGGTHGTPTWYALACFTLLIGGANVAYTWLRLRSGSLGPVVLMHAMHNAAIYLVLDPLTTATGLTPYFSGETGLLPALASLAAGLLIWRLRGGAGARQLQPAAEPAA